MRVDRRDFVRTAAAAGLVAAPRAEAATASQLSDIDHIIILMKENRSFDHYFGTLRGVRGFSDAQAMRLPDGRSVFHQPDPEHPEGFVLPFRLDTTRTSAQRLRALSHAWGALHASLNHGAMDQWIPAHRVTDKAFAPLTMGCLLYTSRCV